MNAYELGSKIENVLKHISLANIVDLCKFKNEKLNNIGFWKDRKNEFKHYTAPAWSAANIDYAPYNRLCEGLSRIFLDTYGTDEEKKADQSLMRFAVHYHIRDIVRSFMKNYRIGDNIVSHDE